MTRIVAAVDEGPVSSAVVEVAEALQPALGSRVEVLTVAPDDPGTIDSSTTAETVLEAATAGDVAVLVVGARSSPGGPRPVGHVTRAVLVESEVVVAVVPPEIDRSRDPISAVLLPLEGGAAPNRRVTEIVDALAAAGSTIDQVHVFDRSTAPPFWDRWQDEQLYADQFSTRFAPQPTGTELRSGNVAQQIREAADAHRSTLIVLEWGQRLGGHRAPVVRDLLCNSAVPLLLVPTDDEEGDGDA